MDLSDILLAALIVIAVTPVVLVAILGIATRFDWPIAERILDVMLPLLAIQWIVGVLVNIVIGLALMALGGWFAWSATSAWRWLVTLSLIAFGAWRTWRAALLLGSFRDPN